MTVRVSISAGEIAEKDVILPGGIRKILNQVVTAEKQAQANLIRRRGGDSGDAVSAQYGEADGG